MKLRNLFLFLYVLSSAMVEASNNDLYAYTIDASRNTDETISLQNQAKECMPCIACCTCLTLIALVGCSGYWWWTSNQHN